MFDKVVLPRIKTKFPELPAPDLITKNSMLLPIMNKWAREIKENSWILGPSYPPNVDDHAEIADEVCDVEE